MGIPYKQFKIRHPEYDAQYWRRCRALYAGGKKLLGDKELMAEIFPRHLNEEEEVYIERRKRAFYLPYASQVIDYITSALSSDPVSLDGEVEGSDSFYKEFLKDISPEGGKKMSFNELLKHQVHTALCCKRAWSLVDFPALEAQPASLAEEDDIGARDAYVVPVDPECVIDWEETDQGEIVFAIVRKESRRRQGLMSDRSVVREEFTYYTAEGWNRYAIEYKEGEAPTDETEVPLEDTGTHSFGKTPLISLSLPDGLWAMGKIEGVAVEHFNKRCALSWGQYRSLFQFYVAFLEEADPTKPISEDGGRAINQRIGPGRMMIMSGGDKIQTLGPDPEPFMVAMQDLDNLRDEIHRVLHNMALSVDNSSSSLRRSAKSKRVDQAATTVILKELGRLMREHGELVLETVVEGRGDDKDVSKKLKGLDEFDALSFDQFLEEVVVMETVDIQSHTFWQEYKYIAAKRALGNGASDEVLLEIREQLKQNITAESLAQEKMLDMPATKMKPGNDNDPMQPKVGSGAPRVKKRKPE